MTAAASDSLGMVVGNRLARTVAKPLGIRHADG